MSNYQTPGTTAQPPRPQRKQWWPLMSCLLLLGMCCLLIVGSRPASAQDAPKTTGAHQIYLSLVRNAATNDLTQAQAAATGCTGAPNTLAVLNTATVESAVTDPNAGNNIAHVCVDKPGAPTPTNTPVVQPTSTATPTNVPTGTPATYGSLGDQIWVDQNHNGLQDNGEPYLAGVTVRLLQGCTGNTVLDTMVTDVNGWYTFYGLTAGQYRVQYVLPAGYQATLKQQGSNLAVDSNINADGVTDCITLAAGQNDMTRDAGIYPTTNPTPTPTPTGTPSAYGSLGDQIWVDQNHNGLQDNGEPYLAGVTVRLLQGCTGNTVLANILTDVNGWYTFYGLTAGQYRLQYVLPSGYQFTLKQQGGNPAADSNTNPDGTTDCITLAAGQNDNTWDAGVYQGTNPTPTPTPTPGGNTTGVGDFVWDDLNKNGIQDPDEPGLAGVKVGLYNATTNTLLFAQVTTNGGQFLFTNLTPGSYYLCFQPPAAPPLYVLSPKLQGIDRSRDSNVDPTTGCTAPFNLTVGQPDLTIDAGFYDPPAVFGIGSAWVNGKTKGAQVYLPWVGR